jgi:uncharacterized protein
VHLVAEAPERAAVSRAAEATPSHGAAGSAIYAGHVHHVRHEPVRHAFSYRVFMPLLDLDELPDLLDPIPLWSARRPAPARWRRSDYLGPPELPLAEAARRLAGEQLGIRPAGPVKLLANPRYWGVGFNPVTFLFLYGDGPVPAVEALIAEVTNTPWGERRAYALAAGPEGLRGDLAKRLHVSPFMPMQQRYLWEASEPGERLTISIANHEQGREVFRAGLSLQRYEIAPRRMRRLLFAYPPMTLATLARIYLNAVKLKLKGAPYFSHGTGEDG